MTQLLTISLNDETAELVEKLKAKDINVSKAFCTALVAYFDCPYHSDFVFK